VGRHRDWPECDSAVERMNLSYRACYTRGMFSVEGLESALRSLGAVLEGRGLSCGVLVAGGSSLLLLGFIDRPTADLDVIGMTQGDRYVKAATIPEPLAAAASDVGAALGLAANWLNNGPASLFDFGLPEGFETRVSVLRYGTLDVHVMGRFDLLCFKLYAAVDQSGLRESKHLVDLRALEPTPQELRRAALWTRTHDPSEGFNQELIKVLARLELEPGDGDL